MENKNRWRYGLSPAARFREIFGKSLCDLTRENRNIPWMYQHMLDLAGQKDDVALNILKLARDALESARTYEKEEILKVRDPDNIEDIFQVAALNRGGNRGEVLTDTSQDIDWDSVTEEMRKIPCEIDPDEMREISDEMDPAETERIQRAKGKAVQRGEDRATYRTVLNKKVNDIFDQTVLDQLKADLAEAEKNIAYWKKAFGRRRDELIEAEENRSLPRKGYDLLTNKERWYQDDSLVPIYDRLDYFRNEVKRLKKEIDREKRKYNPSLVPRGRMLEGFDTGEVTVELRDRQGKVLKMINPREHVRGILRSAGDGEMAIDDGQAVELRRMYEALAGEILIWTETLLSPVRQIVEENPGIDMKSAMRQAAIAAVQEWAGWADLIKNIKEFLDTKEAKRLAMTETERKLCKFADDFKHFIAVRYGGNDPGDAFGSFTRRIENLLESLYTWKRYYQEGGYREQRIVMRSATRGVTAGAFEPDDPMAEALELAEMLEQSMGVALPERRLQRAAYYYEKQQSGSDSASV